MSVKPTVLVTGATGQQGGAAVSELLKSDKVVIRIMTRDPESDKSKALQAKGIEVVKGDMFDSESLVPALTGCEGVFLVTTFAGPRGTEGEISSAKVFIDASRAAGVKHIVFTSTANAETNTGISHFDSKFVIEEYIRASGLEYTILRPVSFMENVPVESSMMRYMTLGVFGSILQGKSLKWIAVQDIGWFAARALESPEEWKGKEIALAGDDLTVEQVKDAFAKAQGGKPWKAPLPLFALNAFLPVDMNKMFTFFREKGYQGVDIPALRKIHPGLLTFEQWLRTKQ